MSFIACQEEVLSFQRCRLDFAGRAFKAGENLVSLQEASRDAAERGVKAGLKWIELWTPKR